eukprot:COSAG01_NODE_2255_length_8070_cov_25.147786_11_plen_164_part_00
MPRSMHGCGRGSRSLEHRRGDGARPHPPAVGRGGAQEKIAARACLSCVWKCIIMYHIITYHLPRASAWPSQSGCPGPGAGGWLLNDRQSQNQLLDHPRPHALLVLVAASATAAAASQAPGRAAAAAALESLVAHLTKVCTHTLVVGLWAWDKAGDSSSQLGQS